VHSSSCERCCDDGGKGGKTVFNLCKIQFANFTAINKEPAAREVGVSVTNGAQEPRAGIWESLGSLGTGDRNPRGVPAEKWKVLGTREPEAETDEETESGKRQHTQQHVTC